MLDALLTRLVPNQAGALWIGALVTLTLLADFNRVISRKNAVLCGLLIMAPLLVDLIHWRGQRAAYIFTAIYFVTALYAAWGLFLAMKHTSFVWSPNLALSGNLAVLIFALILNAVVVFGRAPDDAGIYSNLGAQRWTETGVLPYGDPKLKGLDSPAHGAAATYGPLLYLSHIPLQWLLRGRPPNTPGADPTSPSYSWPPLRATQLATFIFQVIGVFALYQIVSRLANASVGLSAAALFAASPYVIGLGGERWLAGGLAYISHIAPTAVCLLAFMMIARPFVSGALLAVAAGLLYFPAFFFPLWLGWWFWRRKREKHGATHFAAGFALVGSLIVGLIIVFTPAPEGSSSLSMFIESTLEHQEGPGESEYGLSKFGFWGTHPGLASFWHVPLVGSGSLFKPTFMIFAALCLAGFFLARDRTIRQMAGLTAMLAAAIQLWKSHASGTYVEWYYPFLLIALLGGSAASKENGGEKTPEKHDTSTLL